MRERSRIIRVAAAGLLALLLGVAIAGCSRDEQTPTAGTAALRAPGQWLVVNYWAEWCKPCLEEIPQLDEFARRHTPRVRVVLVNFDGLSGEALQRQAAALGIAPDLLAADPALEFGLERPQALPSTFIIDAEGKLKTVLLGPQTVASLEAATDAGATP